MLPVCNEFETAVAVVCVVILAELPENDVVADVTVCPVVVTDELILEEVSVCIELDG